MKIYFCIIKKIKKKKNNRTGIGFPLVSADTQDCSIDMWTLKHTTTKAEGRVSVNLNLTAYSNIQFFPQSYQLSSEDLGHYSQNILRLKVAHNLLI